MHVYYFAYRKIVASDWDIAVGYPASAVVHNTSSVVWQDEGCKVVCLKYWIWC